MPDSEVNKLILLGSLHVSNILYVECTMENMKYLCIEYIHIIDDEHFAKAIEQYPNRLFYKRSEFSKITWEHAFTPLECGYLINIVDA